MVTTRVLPRLIVSPQERSVGAMSHPRPQRLTADCVVVKLRSHQAMRKRLERALEGGPAPVLETLMQNGYARRIQPIFSTPPQARAGLIPKLSAAVSAATEDKATRALVSIRVDSSVRAEDLAAYLRDQGEEIEYAFVPPIKHYFAQGSTNVGPDPLSSRQWAHGAVKIHVARQQADFKDAQEVKVAVVDSGIDEDHPDLKDSISSYVNYIANEDKRDVVGHGTHVAGIIAAGINNAVGVSGLCRAKIMVVKGLPHPDSDYDPDEYYRALSHPVDHGADIINLSLGGGYDAAERDIIEDALEAGITVVAAMGNEYAEGNPVEYPAGYSGVIAVGACDEMDRRASFSNTGDHIDLVAPGVRILSTVPQYPSLFAATVLYDSWPGTSMATPHVAAAAALLKARDGSLKPVDVQESLRASADRVSHQAAHPDEDYGWGRLNIANALL